MLAKHRKGNILLVDDDSNFRTSLSLLLKKKGYNVYEAENGKHAIKVINTISHIDVIITDLKMEEMDGLSLLAYVHKHFKDIPVFIITAYGSIDSAVQAMKLGAYDYIVKPFDFSELESKLSKALKSKKFSVYDSEESLVIVGKGTWVTNLKSIITKFANTDLPILITGETGTGKTHVAKYIHNLSNRHSGPFISVNCSAVPEALCESEFLGHTKGAFTGAVEEKKGLIEAADKGTLLLDEIADMPLPMQAKLLDVLEKKTIRKLGSVEERRVDVRFIAATNKNIEREVDQGNFRRDLFYRLSTVRIEIPPLRQRKEDIPDLANYFIEIYKQKYEKDYIKGLSEAAIEAMLSYDYPGNIRELSNIIAYAVLSCEDECINVDDLPEYLIKNPNTHIQEQSFYSVEKSLIIETLKRSRTVQEAANTLGISRITLWRKMRKYGISPKDYLDQSKV